jgi:hypothetical protein
MNINKTIATATTTLGLALAPMIAAAPAFAQDVEVTQEGVEAGAQYSDEMLEAFVMAALDVAELRQTYQDRLEAAPSPEEQQVIVDEANNEILGVVEQAEGISIDQYIEIGQMAAADPELNARIIGLMQEEAPLPE